MTSARLTREEREGLTLALAGYLRSRSLRSGQLADDDADEEQQHDAQPDARLVHRERVARLGEEEVVEDEGGDGGGDRAGSAADDGRRHDGDEVDGRRVGHAEAVLQDGDDDGRQGEGHAGDGEQPDECASRAGDSRGDRMPGGYHRAP